MNAFAFVKGLFGGVGGAGAVKGAKKPRPSPASSSLGKGSAGKKGKADAHPNSSAVLLELFHLITSEDARVFEDAIPPLLEGRALDAQVASHASKDTLLCHAVRHDREGHVQVLLGLRASPAAPNGLGTTPLQLARLCASPAVHAVLLSAVIDYSPLDAASDALDPSAAPALAGRGPSPLQSLALVHARLSRETVSLLALNLGGLTALDLSGSFAGSLGARDLASALARRPCSLVVLGLGGNSIGCRGCSEVCEMLVVNESLTSLDLSENDIGDEGAASICRAIKANQTLTCLDVGGNPIGQSSVLKLINVVRGSENIRRLGGCDKLLAPVKLRRIVENNSEGRDREGESESSKQQHRPAPPRSGEESAGEDEDEVDDLRSITRSGATHVAAGAAAAGRAKAEEAGEEEGHAGAGGGGWDCIKASSVSVPGNAGLSFKFRLGTNSITVRGGGGGDGGKGGGQKPVSGYTIAVCRRRFNLKWQVVHLMREGQLSSKGGGGSVSGLFAWRTFDMYLDCLAGDEFSLWCRVEPLGKGEVGGEVREWKLGGGGLNGGCLREKTAGGEAWK